MSLSTYTRDELRDIILNHIRGRVTGANTAPGSHYFAIATAIATVVHGEQATAQFLVEQILPTTSEQKYLEIHAYQRGLERLPAAPARGLARVQASAQLVTIPEGSKLTHASGRKYTVTRSALTRTTTFGSRTIAPGTTRQRLIIRESISTVRPRDLVIVPIGGTDRIGVVREVVPPTGTPFALDLYVPFDAAPAPGATLNATDPIGAVIELVADEPGAAGNLRAGEVLTLDDPPTNVTAQVVILELGGGGDAETNDELRERVLSWMAERPGSANRADFRQWMRETPGVRLADGFVYPAYRGPGTVDVIPFGVSGHRSIGELALNLVRAHLEEHASMHDDVLVRRFHETTPIDTHVRIRHAAGFEPDWDGSYTANANAALNLVSVSSGPELIDVGHRVLVQTGTVFPRLYQRTVVGKMTGPFRLVLDEPLPEPVTPGSTIRPGGPLAQPVIDAVLAVFDALGPGDTMDAARFPDTGKAFPDALARARLTSAVMDVEGVLDVEIVTPTADEYPTTFGRLTLGAFQLQWVD